jgi:hypothetical protein
VVFPGDTDEVKDNSLAGLALSQYGAATGVSSRTGQIIADSMANITGVQQDAYAVQAATDYYLWALSVTDCTLRGVWARPITGLDDVQEWVNDRDIYLTRVLRTPFADRNIYGDRPPPGITYPVTLLSTTGGGLWKATIRTTSGGSIGNGPQLGFGANAPVLYVDPAASSHSPGDTGTAVPDPLVPGAWIFEPSSAPDVDSLPVTTQSGSTYTLQAADLFTEIVFTASAVTVTLPASGGAFVNGYACVLRAAAGTTITLSSTQTIDGIATIGPLQDLWVVFDGTNWKTIRGWGPTTTAGDIYTVDTAPQRLAVGTQGQLLSVNTTQPTKLQWINPCCTTTSGTSTVPSVGTSATIAVVNSAPFSANTAVVFADGTNTYYANVNGVPSGTSIAVTVTGITAGAAGNTLASGASVNVASPPSGPAPGAPTALAATTGNQSVNLTWSAPSGNPAPVAYAVYDASSSGAVGSSSPVAYVTTTSALITGLTNGVAKFFAVQAIGQLGGISAFTSVISATPNSGSQTYNTSGSHTFTASFTGPHTIELWVHLVPATGLGFWWSWWWRVCLFCS